MNNKPYHVGDLIQIAISSRRHDPMRVLATYADRSNWKAVHDKDENGEVSAWWAWVGPVIVGYELAQYVTRNNKEEE